MVIIQNKVIKTAALTVLNIPVLLATLLLWRFHAGPTGEFCLFGVPEFPPGACDVPVDYFSVLTLSLLLVLIVATYIFALKNYKWASPANLVVLLMTSTILIKAFSLFVHLKYL